VKRFSKFSFLFLFGFVWGKNLFHLKKPNIYLYPEKDTRIEVKLIGKEDVSITNTKPSYKDGWRVWVTKGGKINNEFSYLFYEALLTYVPDVEKGYCVEGKEIWDFFGKIMEEIGFNELEIVDFINYWSEKLEESPYYLIFPLFNEEIEKIISLDISPKPDRILRVWFLIRKSKEKVKLKKPQLPIFSRNGFSVVEWGVLMESD